MPRGICQTTQIVNPMTRKRVLIDTDPGIDDALAILLAIASPEIQVEGITIVGGNATLHQATQNALSILELCACEHIPVSGGSERPLVNIPLYAAETHGDSGLGYAYLPEPSTLKNPVRAVDFMIDKILNSPGDLTLICLGPLTNLALALRLEPRIASALREVIVMGGAIRHPGNATPQAEFNIYCDPHAAHIVFHAGLPLTLVPLDVTYQALLTETDVQRLLRIASPLSTFIADSTRFYMKFHDDYQKIKGCMINDPLALALSFAPWLVDFQELFVDVDISGGVSMGNIFADFFEIGKNPPNMQVALEVRARDFLELFLERMETFAREFPAQDQGGAPAVPQSA